MTASQHDLHHDNHRAFVMSNITATKSRSTSPVRLAVTLSAAARDGANEKTLGAFAKKASRAFRREVRLE